MTGRNYRAVEAELRKIECPKCHGAGEQDDMTPGDISFRTWKCTTCKGTGFKDGIEWELKRKEG